MAHIKTLIYMQKKTAHIDLMAGNVNTGNFFSIHKFLNQLQQIFFNFPFLIPAQPKTWNVLRNSKMLQPKKN